MLKSTIKTHDARIAMIRTAQAERSELKALEKQRAMNQKNAGTVHCVRDGKIIYKNGNSASYSGPSKSKRTTKK